MQKLFTAYGFALIALFILITGTATAETRARAYIDDVGEIIVGQTISFYVDIETDDEKLGPFLFPDITVDGIIILQPEQLGTSYSKTEKGQQIIGLRKKYAVIPKRSGDLTLPAVAISWSETPEKTISTEPVTFQVITPQGVDNLARLIVGENIKIRQEIVPTETELKQGDAITRTIRITAEDTLGLTLPPAEFVEIGGLAAYPESPQMSDNINRGQYSAQRIDRIVYIAEAAGTITLPEIFYEAWDLSRNTVNIVTLPAETFEIAKVAGSSFSNADDNTIRGLLIDFIDVLRTNMTSVFWILAILAGGKYFARKYGRKGIRAITDYTSRYRQSEKYAFRRLLRRCGSLSPSALHNEMWSWLSVLCGKEGILTLADVEVSITDTENRAFLDATFRTPYAARKDGKALTRSDLRAGLVNLRQYILRTQAQQSRHSNTVTLNPLSQKV
jgi:oxygen tolerance protein BatD